MAKLMQKKEVIEDQIAFYDKESRHYSEKRYPLITASYTQYIFKKRLQIFLDLLEEIIPTLPHNPTLLEIGCADGIVIKHIERRFPGVFHSFVGVDISREMIEEAKKANNNDRVSFALRDNLAREKFNIIVELGVHSYDLDSELLYVGQHMLPGGHFFYSCVGRSSIFTYMKLRHKDYVKDYRMYKEYENLLKKEFIIERSRAYGIFVPKLWSIAFIGRIFQSVIDFSLQKATPELFHEKIYLLEKKS